MYKVTYCANQCKKSGDDTKDSDGHSYVFCKLSQKPCVSQRWCPEQQKYIVSERANSVCKNYR